MKLAEKLQELRKKKEQSLQEVADAIGASRAHVWEVETGRTRNPSFELVRRLADHYGVSVAWLADEMPSDGDHQAAALYRAFQALSPQNKEHVQAIIESMRKSGG